MDTKVCKYCGEENFSDMKFCSHCGKKFEEEKYIFCPECGTKNKAGENFCEECGSSLRKKSKENDARVEKHEEKQDIEEVKQKEEKDKKNKEDSKSEYIFCPECGTKNYASKKFCKECGSPLKEKVKEKDAEIEKPEENQDIEETRQKEEKNKKNKEESKPEYIFCPECGTKNYASKKFCKECGSSLKEEVKEKDAEIKKYEEKQETEETRQKEEKEKINYKDEEDTEKIVSIIDGDDFNKIDSSVDLDKTTIIKKKENKNLMTEKELDETVIIGKNNKISNDLNKTVIIKDKRNDLKEEVENKIKNEVENANISSNEKKKNKKSKIVIIIILLLAISLAFTYKFGLLENFISNSDKNNKVEENKTENEWSEWVDKLPKKITDSEYQIETKTQYSTKTKKTKTSNSKTLNGWTLDKSKTSANNELTKELSSESEISKFEKKSDITIVKKEILKEKYTAVLCGYYTVPENGNRFYSANTEKPYCDKKDSYELTEKSEENDHGKYSVGDLYQEKYYTNSDGTLIYYKVVKVTPTSVKYTYTDNSDGKNYFYKWTSWSEYSDKKVEEDENTKVKTRTMYRYKVK